MAQKRPAGVNLPQSGQVTGAEPVRSGSPAVCAALGIGAGIGVGSGRDWLSRAEPREVFGT